MSELTVDTPAVLVDLEIVEQNVSRYQKYCDAHGLKLRPHIKTHKIPRLAGLQIARGATGITCQKVSEAEAMVTDGNIRDVLIILGVIGIPT